MSGLAGDADRGEVVAADHLVEVPLHNHVPRGRPAVTGHDHAAFAGGGREGRGWWIFFGAISVIAGIVVVSTPVDSLTVLAVLIGIWFIIMGIIEIIGGLMIRRAARTAADSLGGPAEHAVADGTV